MKIDQTNNGVYFLFEPREWAMESGATVRRFIEEFKTCVGPEYRRGDDAANHQRKPLGAKALGIEAMSKKANLLEEMPANLRVRQLPIIQ